MTVLAPKEILATTSKPLYSVFTKQGASILNCLDQNAQHYTAQIIYQTDDILTLPEHSKAILYDLSIGIDKLANLRQHYPLKPILAILNSASLQKAHSSSFDLDTYIAQLFALGANDYIEQSDLTNSLLKKVIQKATYRMRSEKQQHEQRFAIEQSLRKEQHRLSVESFFRAEINKFINDILTKDQNDTIYQTMLEKAVAIIPNAQAGSMVLKFTEGYKFVAAVGFDLDILSSIFFDIQDFKTPDWTEPKVINYYDNAWDDLADYKRDVLIRSGPAKKIKAALSIPIVQDDDVVIIFNLDNFDAENIFDSSAIEMAQLFATQVGTIWQRIQLENNLRQEQERLVHEASFRAELNSLMGEVLSQSSDEKTYQYMLEKAVEIIPGADAGSMALLTAHGYYFVAAVGFKLDILANTVFDLEDFCPPNNWSKPILKSYFKEDWENLAKHKQTVFTEAGASKEIKASLSIPIFKNDDIVLIFNLDSLTAKDTFDTTSISMSQMFATQIEAIWQRFELEKSFKDNEQR